VKYDAKGGKRMDKNRTIAIFVKLGIIEKAGKKQKKISELSLLKQFILVLGTIMIMVVQIMITCNVADFISLHMKSFFSIAVLFTIILTAFSWIVSFIALFILCKLVVK
jgi:hypothetical protein